MLTSFRAWLFVSTLLSQAAFGQTALEWVQTWGGSGGDESYAVAIDGSGNALVTRIFQGTVDFDPGIGQDIHSSAGGYDIYVTKFDASGTFLWARTWGGSQDDVGNYVGADGGGNVYVAGVFHGTMDLDPGSGVDVRSSAGLFDAVLIKLDPDGNYLWGDTFGGTGEDHLPAIDVDPSGNVYGCGYWSSPTLDLDPGPGVDLHNNLGNYDVFAFKFNTDGELVWARTAGSSGFDGGQGVTVGPDGTVFVTGFFVGTADFDPGANSSFKTSTGANDAFVWALDSNGELTFVDTFGSTGDEKANRISVNGSGELAVSGFFNNTADFDPGAGTALRTSSGTRNAYILRLAPDGAFRWVRTFPSSAAANARGVWLNDSGAVYATGHFAGVMDFGDPIGDFTTAGAEDAFVVKFSSVGSVVWAHAIGGTGQDQGISIYGTPENELYVTGNFSDSVDFDPAQGEAARTSLGGTDVFVMKLADEPNGGEGSLEGEAQPEGEVQHADLRIERFVDGNNTYLAGQVALVNVRISKEFTESLSALALSESLPPGWTIHSVVDAAGAVSVPSAGDSGVVNFIWLDPPALPAFVHYRLNVPQSATGDVTLSGEALYRVGAGEQRTSGIVSTVVGPGHDESHCSSVDTDHNWNISLAELLRCIQFYNFGGLHCSEGTEDGFAPGPGDEQCPPCDLDYLLQDWNIELNELLRLIQFYNSRGSAYYVLSGTEDGFSPGVYQD